MSNTHNSKFKYLDTSGIKDKKLKDFLNKKPTDALTNLVYQKTQGVIEYNLEHEENKVNEELNELYIEYTIKQLYNLYQLTRKVVEKLQIGELDKQKIEETATIYSSIIYNSELISDNLLSKLSFKHVHALRFYLDGLGKNLFIINRLTEYNFNELLKRIGSINNKLNFQLKHLITK